MPDSRTATLAVLLTGASATVAQMSRRTDVDRVAGIRVDVLSAAHALDYAAADTPPGDPRTPRIRAARAAVTDAVAALDALMDEAATRPQTERVRAAADALAAAAAKADAVSSPPPDGRIDG